MDYLFLKYHVPLALVKRVFFVFVHYHCYFVMNESFGYFIVCILHIR